MVHPVPRRVEDLLQFIRASTPEGPHLDYKASQALLNTKWREDLAKDASAFANADGGLLIYGVVEKGHIPVSVDAGVPTQERTREQIESVLLSTITPRIGIEIVQIPITPERSAFAVSVSKALSAALQAPDKRFYKRFNFQAQPMEAYEIADIGRRALAHPPEVVLRFDVERYLFRLVLENPTQRAAYDVSFSMPRELAWWLDKHQPTALLNGLGVLWPGARLHYLLGSSFEWLSDESTHSRSFTISYTWRSPDHEIRADRLEVDVSRFLGSNAEVTPIERVGDQLNKNLEKLGKQVEQIAKGLDELVSRVSQPTGLALSTTTLRNLAHVLARDGEWRRCRCVATTT